MTGRRGCGSLKCLFGAGRRSSRLMCGLSSQRRGGAGRKSTRLNSSHANISYAVFCLKKKKTSGLVVMKGWKIFDGSTGVMAGAEVTASDVTYASVAAGG